MKSLWTLALMVVCAGCVSAPGPAPTARRGGSPAERAVRERAHAREDSAIARQLGALAGAPATPRVAGRYGRYLDAHRHDQGGR